MEYWVTNLRLRKEIKNLKEAFGQKEAIYIWLVKVKARVRAAVKVNN